ncbi:PepSY-associated TM helix domain-containing protein [Mesoterricola silvestris]|uniref:Peptidase n=1 Tax=Mesoterricola silvestris TaxID=2927979 RepID=A0AA48H5L8_9BACT|nr:PepSY-associated TM helix domain-containing protein [Mesoterricola silvestris]BDU72288.1 peptidase [Mesoterricola silvestris]
MRGFLKRFHRLAGLATALFLVLAGLTGAVIAWDHELDAALNPRFFRAPGGAALPALELADRLERGDPRLRVTYAPLAVPPGHTWLARVEPRLDPATGRPYALGFDQVAVDPATGAIQARRLWGRLSLAREDLLPCLYKLHYSLHLPGTWGVLLMGCVGLLWTFDCFAALAASFPSLPAWRRSFRFRFGLGWVRAVFDLHRSGGVWAWGALLVLAATSVSMNLGDPVVRPLVGRLSTLAPSPFDPREAGGPAVDRRGILDAARAEAARRGWTRPPGGLFLASGVYGVGFFEPGRDHGDGGLGNAWLYFRARDGAPAGAQVPGEGSAGDVFLQAQFPLHSGRILGLPGRVLVSALGLAVAALSATGVALWARRRYLAWCSKTPFQSSPGGAPR